MAPPNASNGHANSESTTTTTNGSLHHKSTTTIPTLSPDSAEQAISKFQSFLKFETVSALAQESGAYVECAKFLVDELTSLGVLTDVHCLPEAPDHSPVVVAKWTGVDDSLPILLWNSHYDVVPAKPEDWTVEPFGAIRRNGNIYGRGAQDMKCVCMQYIEALRYIVTTHPDWKPQRTMFLTFVPDEECGGGGMEAFLESKCYKNDIVNQRGGIALALDEGLASTTNTFSVFYGERLPWWCTVEATGPTGHASRFIENTAVEQLIELANKALAFRQGQKQDLLGMDTAHENCTHAVVAKKSKAMAAVAVSSAVNDKKPQKSLGDVTTLNITSLQAGVYAGNQLALNCVPPVAQCSLDIRISPHTEPKEIKDMLNRWCQECSKDPQQGHQITWKYVGDNSAQQHATTSTDPAINPWYQVFTTSLKDMGCDMEPQVFPAATDSRFLRALGVRALGFSPMRNTEIMLHENDEYIPETTFLEGIGVYINLIQALGSQGPEMDQHTSDQPATKKAKVN